jgi:galactose mutarotase-like enzyme
MIILAGSGLRAEITPLGAELMRLQDEASRELLWDGDPAFWTGRSPLLFPIVGAVKDDRIRVDGVTYPLSKHGFARASQFEVIEAEAESCLLRLTSSEATLSSYPFPFRLEIAYRIAGAALLIEATLTNPGPDILPASFGFHPALRWPLPYGGDRAAHELRFEKAESAPLRRLVADGLIGNEVHQNPIQGTRLALRDDLFVADALIFDRIASRSVEFGVPGRRRVRVTFPEMPHLGIWTKPGAGYLCIEPWQGFASPEDFDGEFARKPGLIALAPNATRTFAMAISLTE